VYCRKEWGETHHFHVFNEAILKIDYFAYLGFITPSVEFAGWVCLAVTLT